MRILRVHNYYRFGGGEDVTHDAEVGLLRDYGHEVILHEAHSREAERMHPVPLLARMLWNGEAYREIRTLIRRHRPDVAHFINTVPMISPAALWAAHSIGVPVIQHLLEYRMFCVKSFPFRDGRVCEDCFRRRLGWPALLHACYQGSRSMTAGMISHYALHGILRTWTRAVDLYVAGTEFNREKFVQAGLPADRVVVKPNFVYPDPGPGRGSKGYFLFVGHLIEEKGVATLLSAWERLKRPVPLRIVGDGPLRNRVTEACRRMPCIEWLGRLDHAAMLNQMKRATALVFPSVWFEGCTRVVIEAFSTGLPVLGSDLGSTRSMIEEGRTGLRFTPADPDSLAKTVAAWSDDPRMRREARAEYERKYTGETNHQQLMEIYRRARTRRGDA